MYYQSSAKPNDPSEPESDRLKTLLDNLNNLRGKLKNFTVIDELGQPIGEISDLILDAGHQLNLVIAQPDAQARQSSVLLNGRRIKKVSVQTQSVFVDITKADVRFLPEYLLPDEAAAPPPPADLLEAPVPASPDSNGGLNLAAPPAAAVTPDFSLDVMESPPESDLVLSDDDFLGIDTPDATTDLESLDLDLGTESPAIADHDADLSQSWPEEPDFLTTDETAQEDLGFLDMEEPSTNELDDLELPNEARSLDEFGLLDNLETSEPTTDLPDLALGDFGDENLASDELPDLAVNTDASEEWAEFDRIMATEPAAETGTLNLDNPIDAFEDSNPVPEAFALIDSETGDQPDDLFADDLLAEAANNLNPSDLTEDALPDLNFDPSDSFASINGSATEELSALSFEEATDDPLSSLDLDSESDLPDLSLDETDPSLSMALSPEPDLGNLSNLSFDHPDRSPSLDLSAESELPDLSFDETPDDLAALDFSTAQTEEDLSGLSFDDPAPLPALDLSATTDSTPDSTLESEWAEFDREMDLPSIDLASLETTPEPSLSTTELDFTNLEMPEEVAASVDFGPEANESDALFGDSELPENPSSEASMDFDDALSFVDTEDETSSNFNDLELVGDTNAIAFTEDAPEADADLETISSLADLDFTSEAAADVLGEEPPESFDLVATDPSLDLDLEQPTAPPLDLDFDLPEALNLAETAPSLDFNLDQPESLNLEETDTGFDLNLDQLESENTLTDLSFDQSEPAAALDLEFDQPEPDNALADFSFDQSASEPSLDLGFDQPESALDLGFDQPESEPSLDLSFDQPESAAASLLDLDFDQTNPEVSSTLSFDEPESPLDLGLETTEEGSLDLNLEQEVTEPSLDLGLDESESPDLTDVSPTFKLNVDDTSAPAPEVFSDSLADLDFADSTPDLPTPPSLNLDELELSSAPIPLPANPLAFVDQPTVDVEPEFGLESIPAETFELANSAPANLDLSATEALTEVETTLPLDSVDAIVPILEERLKVEYERRKVGEIVVRKRIETRMVQVPVRYEKLVIEQVGDEPKTLAEVDLSQGLLDNLEVPVLSGKAVVSGDFKSAKTASLVLDAIAKTLKQRCKNIRIEVELDDPKLQKAYQEWIDQCSQI